VISRCIASPEPIFRCSRLGSSVMKHLVDNRSAPPFGEGRRRALINQYARWRCNASAVICSCHSIIRREQKAPEYILHMNEWSDVQVISDSCSNIRTNSVPPADLSKQARSSLTYCVPSATARRGVRRRAAEARTTYGREIYTQQIRWQLKRQQVGSALGHWLQLTIASRAAYCLLQQQSILFVS
jgi:hypothetical protein